MHGRERTGTVIRRRSHCIMRAVQREIKLPRIIVVGRVVTRILLGVFFTHSGSYVQVSSAQGLNTEIAGVRISADRRPVVTLKIGDGQGRPLDLCLTLMTAVFHLPLQLKGQRATDKRVITTMFSPKSLHPDSGFAGEGDSKGIRERKVSARDH